MACSLDCPQCLHHSPLAFPSQPLYLPVSSLTFQVDALSIVSTLFILLSFPREIRDVIYGYLYCEIHYDCQWGRDHHMQELDVAVVDINLKNAPLYSMLLTSRQIHDEYKEELDSRRFSATVATKPFPNQHALHCRVSEKHHIEDALSRLRDVNLLIFNHFPGHGFWIVVASLAEFLVRKAPRLRNIQVGTKLDSPKVALHRDLHRPDNWAAYETATHPMFRLESPPLFLAEGFALSVYGEGYHSSYAKTSRLTKFPTPPDETEMANSQLVVARMGLYAYSRAGERVKLIDKSTLVEQWPTSGFMWSCWTVREM